MEPSMPASLSAYLAEYQYKIELHAHSKPVSPCGELTPRELIARLQKEHYDCVVLTNHFYAGGPFMQCEDPVAAYLSDFYTLRDLGEAAGITVLLGAEYRFHENTNDYLVLGIDEAFLRETVDRLSMTEEAFYDAYHREDRLIIQAHPHRNGCTPADPAHLDGVEAFNLHPNHNSRPAITARFARENGLTLITAGTDLHHDGHEGCCAIRTRTLPKTEGELVALLRSRDYILEIGGHPLFPFVNL